MAWATVHDPHPAVTPAGLAARRGTAQEEENTRTTLPKALQGEATQREGRGDPGEVAWGPVFPQAGDRVGDTLAPRRTLTRVLELLSERS